MDLLHSAYRFSSISLHRPSPAPPRNLSRRFSINARAILPFPEQSAKYHRELEVAIDAVERACRLCVDVRKSLLSSDERIVEKNDQTPVTVADFGVQALISLELGKLFPSIPLVAEEDSASLRLNNLVDSVVTEVADKASSGDKQLTETDVLEAIDRGGKDAFTFGPNPATYWVLDPIDGTRGFVGGIDALYVVGLALVVEGEVVLGVMGCPNWKEENPSNSLTNDMDSQNNLPGSGIIMVAHVGCGTWVKYLSDMPNSAFKSLNSWSRSFVDGCQLAREASFCISDSQTWDSLPLSTSFGATIDAEDINDNQVLLRPTCCGSLCKYLMVASGRVSAFVLRARTRTVIKAWDHAVGVICVHEAGGKVTDWSGDHLDLAIDEIERRFIVPSGGILVTNNGLHNEVLELISSSSSIV